MKKIYTLFIKLHLERPILFAENSENIAYLVILTKPIQIIDQLYVIGYYIKNYFNLFITQRASLFLG